MNIHKKLEEIRRQPEHIRLRYVYGALAVSMFFILIIWLFSVKNMFQTTPLDSPEKPFSTLKDSFEESFQETEMPSLEKLLQENEQKMQAELEAQAQNNAAADPATPNVAPESPVTPENPTIPPAVTPVP